MERFQFKRAYEIEELKPQGGPVNGVRRSRQPNVAGGFL
jgi:hypothetical protein